MKIRWSPEAASNLEQIVQYIEEHNPEASLKIAQTILSEPSNFFISQIPAVAATAKELANWL